MTILVIAKVTINLAISPWKAIMASTAMEKALVA